ncbi:gluconate 5-dehydrogenase [Aspergillus heteromorphus CBS 117.55]|uniref:Gluconate 5-dehydrogenase n=1 Tax=Aspergillus heteromorphus CBS 117.55 TaxID=1448321 RepID=A0A317V4A9_9EURO|nr:gluconate 5-dehydrogenase [Aspergillus heteromorphus CBS 117.55]PWY69114.1 gluconate 5-dehydrogenase [Aspergillus heteromorphus CBS 117.55]
MRLLDKVALITGSSSGIGRAIALRYAREGAKIACADITPTARSAVHNETDITTHDAIIQQGGQAFFVQTDAGDEAQMENAVLQTVKQFGRLDIMVNNAGVSLESRTPARIHETSNELFDTTMRVNTRSVFLGSKYAITQMLKQEPHSSGDRGWIVNLSSIMGIVAGTEHPSYCASKGAVSNLTRQVALDYARDRIHVNAVCPGYTRTAIYEETTQYMHTADDLYRRHPFNGPGLPDDIARVAVVLASEDARWMTGAVVPVDGGYTAR